MVLAALALLLLLTGFAWWKTEPPTREATKNQSAAVSAEDLVDQSSYATAQRLSHLTLSPEEQSFAQSALRIADHELDLAFKEALRDVEAHPPTLNSNAAAIQARLDKSRGMLDADQQRVNELTTTLAQAKDAQRDALKDGLDLAQSQLDLDKDELEEAEQDLVDAGGNPKRQIDALVQEHEAQTKAPSSPTLAKPAALGEQLGALGRFREWRQFSQKRQELEDARSGAGLKIEALGTRRAALAASLETAKGGIPELARHTKSAKEAATAPPAHPLQHS